MAVRDGRGDVKQTTTGFRDPRHHICQKQIPIPHFSGVSVRHGSHHRRVNRVSVGMCGNFGVHGQLWQYQTCNRRINAKTFLVLTRLYTAILFFYFPKIKRCVRVGTGSIPQPKSNSKKPKESTD